jgi:hypothetical protein
MPVKKGEVRLPGDYFTPQLKDAKFSFPDIRIVKEHNGVGRQLRQPGLIVMLHGIIGMQAVDMEKVD